MKKIMIYILPFLILSIIGCLFESDVQSVTISGHVYDKTTTKPIPDVLVMIRSTGNAELQTRTDNNGYFSVKTKVDCRGGEISIEFAPANNKPQILHFYQPDANPCELEPLEVYLEPLE